MPIQTNRTGFGTNEFGLSRFGVDTDFISYGTTPGGHSLEALERSWFLVRVPGATPQTSLNELKRIHWENQLGSSYVGASLQALEANWLKKMISNAGKTASNTNFHSTLWKEILSALGIVPTNYINENKMKFFIYQTT